MRCGSAALASSFVVLLESCLLKSSATARALARRSSFCEQSATFVTVVVGLEYGIASGVGRELEVVSDIAGLAVNR